MSPSLFKEAQAVEKLSFFFFLCRAQWQIVILILQKRMQQKKKNDRKNARGIVKQRERGNINSPTVDERAQLNFIFPRQHFFFYTFLSFSTFFFFIVSSSFCVHRVYIGLSPTLVDEIERERESDAKVEHAEPWKWSLNRAFMT